MGDLTCREFVELVTDYLDGALDEVQTARFERHVAECPGCATYLDQLKQTAARLGQIPMECLSAEMRSTLLLAFRDFHRSPRKQ